MAEKVTAQAKAASIAKRLLASAPLHPKAVQAQHIARVPSKKPQNVSLQVSEVVVGNPKPPGWHQKEPSGKLPGTGQSAPENATPTQGATRGGAIGTATDGSGKFPRTNQSALKYPIPTHREGAAGTAADVSSKSWNWRDESPGSEQAKADREAERRSPQSAGFQGGSMAPAVPEPAKKTGDATEQECRSSRSIAKAASPFGAKCIGEDKYMGGGQEHTEAAGGQKLVKVAKWNEWHRNGRVSDGQMHAEVAGGKTSPEVAVGHVEVVTGPEGVSGSHEPVKADGGVKRGPDHLHPKSRSILESRRPEGAKTMQLRLMEALSLQLNLERIWGPVSLSASQLFQPCSSFALLPEHCNAAPPALLWRQNKFLNLRDD